MDEIVASYHTALCIEDFGRGTRFLVRVLGFTLEKVDDQRTDIVPVVALPDACVRGAMFKRERYRLELFKYYTPKRPPAVRLRLYANCARKAMWMRLTVACKPSAFAPPARRRCCAAALPRWFMSLARKIMSSDLSSCADTAKLRARKGF